MLSVANSIPGRIRPYPPTLEETGNVRHEIQKKGSSDPGSYNPFLACEASRKIFRRSVPVYAWSTPLYNKYIRLTENVQRKILRF